jgi:hypothetical protein
VEPETTQKTGRDRKAIRVGKYYILYCMKKLLVFCIAAFASISSFSQDIIVLKTGDEIKSKVLEVTPDLVKYKKWENQDGPIYSSNKSEVFMIKYINGTKDVFNTSTAPNPNPDQNSNLSNGTKFIGTWFRKGYNGNNNKTTMTITKSGTEFLVDYRKLERGGGYDSFYNTDGSFKAMGQLQGSSIVINSFIKLSLLNDNTILMNSLEFTKPTEQKKQAQHTQTQTPPQNSNSQAKPVQKSADVKVQNNRVPLK